MSKHTHMYIYVGICIKTSWQPQTKNLQHTHTHKGIQTQHKCSDQMTRKENERGIKKH